MAGGFRSLLAFWIGGASAPVKRELGGPTDQPIQEMRYDDEEVIIAVIAAFVEMEKR